MALAGHVVAPKKAKHRRLNPRREPVSSDSSPTESVVANYPISWQLSCNLSGKTSAYSRAIPYTRLLDLRCASHDYTAKHSSRADFSSALFGREVLSAMTVFSPDDAEFSVGDQAYQFDVTVFEIAKEVLPREAWK
ncbi:hypothetical protein PPTG_24816 [Phytophthora nicotianae INRA-310]|uniref:Uncharacterized protein n=1 Tax=Phytophthora nicotianae (strain INRA-310) TaxID=761204 RepID=W2PCV2_PHYN3|nr:hypothetical protein PPTG_24816 [Phytophthora nicotianae INRA-310]ETM97824.1 hypothetical protein PPTG_24816 [Phytophthora nicotianae INRA-310]